MTVVSAVHAWKADTVCCSGPGQVMELELKVDSNNMGQLLKFLTGGFNGGTDVDKPLELSLQRLSEKEWNQVGDSAASLSA